jgi:signal peptidase II
MRTAAWVGLATLALDQATKLLVVDLLGLRERLALDVWPPFLTLRMAWNRGVNFGLLAADGDLMRWALVALALAISAWVWIWVARAREGWPVQVAAGLLVGVAIGNAVDRLRWGAVADFLNMSCCGIDNPFAFNLADVAIFAGALGLVLFAGRGRAPGGDADGGPAPPRAPRQ